MDTDMPATRDGARRYSVVRWAVLKGRVGHMGHFDLVHACWPHHASMVAMDPSLIYVDFTCDVVATGAQLRSRACSRYEK